MLSKIASRAKTFFKKSWRLQILIALVLLSAAVALTFWQTRRAYRRAAEQVASETDFRFVVRPLPRSSSSRFVPVSAPAIFAQAAQFHDALFLCGPAGLFEYDSQGKLVHEYRVGQELPPSPLIRISQGLLADAREPELLIATAQEGILAFNGRSFRQIRPENAAQRVITSILAVSTGQLLIGTHKNGVLVYDGKRLTEFHPTLANLAVTEFAGSATDLWVGTQDAGVFHWHAGQSDRFGEAQGLPDAQVTSLVVDGDRAYAGTPVGVAEFERNRFSKVIAPGVFAQSLFLSDDSLYVGTLDQGVRQVALDASHGTLDRGASSELTGVRQVLAAQGSLLAVADGGLFQRAPRSVEWRKLLSPQGATLTDRNISALSVDNEGRLWVGYFDRGMDIVEPGGQGAQHIENDRIFCVNRIVTGGADGTTAVATANGLVIFDRQGKQQQVLKRSDGLIASHVTDIAPYRGGMAVATPAGLTFLGSGSPRSLYAFHGLVNNQVFALAVKRDRLLAGTLGGLSVLDSEQIVANFTTATSGLRHNWITAVVPLGDEWVIGTYGAGIFHLDSTGRIQPYEAATSNFEINPNAMVVTEHHVLAGSLGKGLWVMDRDSGRWRAIVEGLPSANVTALAARNGTLYVGTDNGLVHIEEQDLNP